jgi:Ca-activated chloride channel family protein
MTRINPDDPKWTAYVLGELEDSERAVIEQELENSEEARMLVEELRFAADLTKMELRESVVVTPLTGPEREKIRAEARDVRPREWFGVRMPIWATGFALASVVGITFMVMRTTEFQGRLVPSAAVSFDQARNTAVVPSDPRSAVAPNTPVPADEFRLRYDRPQSSSEADTAEREVQRTQQSVAEMAAGAPRVAAPGVPPPAAVAGITSADLAAPSLAPAEAAGGKGQVSSEVQQNAQEKQDSKLQDAAAKKVEVPRFPTREELNSPFGAANAFRYAERAASAPASPATSRAPGVPRSFDRRQPPYNGSEAYDSISDNPFVTVASNQLSTFSIDVDTASYSNVRRILNQNQSPPRDAVRIEEMINYFSYDYPQPAGNNPIGASIEAAAAPWNPQHRLLRVAIKARDIETQRRPASNLVFLLDVSGSMQPAERLPLLKDGLHMLVEQLTANDRVTVVTYAGTTGIALRATRGDQKDTILRLIDSLQAGGSTNGASGIQLAYEQATQNFIRGGVNRVILATDGDFNVGITDRGSLLRLIEDEAKSGVFLSVLGVGMGNYKDATLEMLADKGNGNYAYIDTLNEARKVLVEQMSGTLITMAKDVKIQVEFNPAVVDAYRLIGYENRALRNEDFNNDLKDAGDMGAGHTVTVLYEVVPRGVAIGGPGVDPLKYQPKPAAEPLRNASNETLTVKVRYKEPSASDSKLLEFPLVDREQPFARASLDFRFAAAVASFGMILRDSPYKGNATFDSVLAMAEDGLGSDRNGYRREFLQLVQRAREIRQR